jgi:toxin ParE1/3/4
LKLTWSPEARDDLRAIAARRRAYSHSSSKALLIRIRARGRQILQFPDSGRAVPELDTPLVRELIEAEFRIIYEWFPDRVEILQVLHGRMSLESLDDESS